MTCSLPSEMIRSIMLNVNDRYRLKESSSREFIVLGTTDNGRAALIGDVVRILNVETQGWNTRVTVEFIEVDRTYVPQSYMNDWTQVQRFYYVDVKNDERNVIPTVTMFDRIENYEQA